MIRVLAIIFLIVVLCGFIASNASKVYVDGMFLDRDLLSLISEEDKARLISFGVYKSSAKYKRGSKAYTVNGSNPNYVSMGATLWDAERSTIHGSSHTMQTRDADAVSAGSGLAFHTIGDDLYAYSSGEIRENPERFRKLSEDLIDQVSRLSGLRESEGGLASNSL